MTKSIPFSDLALQQKRLNNIVRSKISKVLSHGKYIMGPEVEELEYTLKHYVNSKYCISCSSGTDALLMSLLALDVKPGDAVLTTPFTFIATAEVISLIGATPIFIDIDSKTFNIDADLIEQKINDINNNVTEEPIIVIFIFTSFLYFMIDS